MRWLKRCTRSCASCSGGKHSSLVLLAHRICKCQFSSALTARCKPSALLDAAHWYAVYSSAMAMLSGLHRYRLLVDRSTLACFIPVRTSHPHPHPHPQQPPLHPHPLVCESDALHFAHRAAPARRAAPRWRGFSSRAPDSIAFRLSTCTQLRDGPLPQALLRRGSSREPHEHRWRLPRSPPSRRQAAPGG